MAVTGGSGEAGFSSAVPPVPCTHTHTYIHTHIHTQNEWQSLEAEVK